MARCPGQSVCDVLQSLLLLLIMTGDAEAPGKDAAGVLRKQKHYNDSDSLEPDRLSVAVVDDRDHMSSASDDDGSRALQVCRSSLADCAAAVASEALTVHGGAGSGVV